jgi:hypothetical protein
MEETGIADVGAVRPDQPFTHFAMQGLNDTEPQDIFKNFKIARDCWPVHTQLPSIVLTIEQFALIIGNHPPKEFKRLCADLQTKLPDMAR